jgi:hypothetical protein
MTRLRTQLGALTLAMAATMLVSPARGQVRNSAASQIALRAVLPESLTVKLSGNAVNFNLVAGSANNAGSTSITATTTWVLSRRIPLVALYAFFGSASAALTNGAGDKIPSADFQISDNGGAFTALTRTTPFGGANAGLRLSLTPILGKRNGSRTDLMQFNINLGPLPTLPAGAYTGTLTIQAQAF